MLTIAIPTYNRNNILRVNLERLLPQLTNECKLLVVDNNSDIPVEETLRDILDEYRHLDIKIIRNSENVGLTGNILKCFELCSEEWLWILGDDDKVEDLSIGIIVKDLKKYENTHFISYAWDEESFKRKQNIKTNGVEELMDKIESIGVILFISTSIYNIKKVKKYLSYGNFFQSTYAPHLAMLFMSLKDGGECILMKEQIVKNETLNTPPHLRWDQIFIYQMVLLLRLPLKSLSILKMKERLAELTRLWTIEHFIYTITFMDRENEKDRPLVLYEDVVRSFYYLDNRFSTKFKAKIGHIIVKNPKFFKNIMLIVYKLIKKRNFESNNNLRI